MKRKIYLFAEVGKMEGQKMENEKERADLTKKEAHAIAEHIDITLLRAIREDSDIDSMGWLRNMVRGYEKLCRFSGYVGLTEHEEDTEE